ncbi:hypothetical protein JAAARDRAFT_199141 [Jaapia argillacea MUCL 33604]|uniref:Uncharacterized protein n=1 Tax=Jaapia argillacea MUCL 33604 TaxID=933084 RepID=A0A067P9S3_9AGAM|nr:hypothetical protein JAAARDRAFT_199141 [Jaapia argillacea MUCL 33604]
MELAGQLASPEKLSCNSYDHWLRKALKLFLEKEEQECELLDQGHYAKSSYGWEWFAELFLHTQTGCTEIWTQVFGELPIPLELTATGVPLD